MSLTKGTGPFGEHPARTFHFDPREHVRTALLDPSERQHSDPGTGPRTYWTITTGEHQAPDAASAWEPPEDAAAIAGPIAFGWDSVSVLEEDEEVLVHPRDPSTRIDVLRSSRCVRVTVGETVVADSTRARCTTPRPCAVCCASPKARSTWR